MCGLSNVPRRRLHSVRKAVRDLPVGLHNLPALNGGPDAGKINAVQFQRPVTQSAISVAPDVIDDAPGHGLSFLKLGFS